MSGTHLPRTVCKTLSQVSFYKDGSGNRVECAKKGIARQMTPCG